MGHHLRARRSAPSTSSSSSPTAKVELEEVPEEIARRGVVNIVRWAAEKGFIKVGNIGGGFSVIAGTHPTPFARADRLHPRPLRPSPLPLGRQPHHLPRLAARPSPHRRQPHDYPLLGARCWRCRRGSQGWLVASRRCSHSSRARRVLTAFLLLYRTSGDSHHLRPQVFHPA